MVPNIGSFAAAAVHPTRVTPAASTIAPKRSYALSLAAPSAAPTLAR